MARVDEKSLINVVADIEASIDGVGESYRFAKNPETINRFPCVIHYIPTFNMELHGHHNRWLTTWNLRSILIVSPFQRGGRLPYLENETIVYMMKWRQKFQLESSIQSMLALGLTKARLVGGEYAAGTRELTVNGVQYIGCVFTYEFTEIC